MCKKLVVAGVVLTAFASVAGWFAYKPLLARHYVNKLESSPDDETVDRIADFGEASVSPLIEMLKRDAPASGHASYALQRVLDRWQPDDPRAPNVARKLASSFADFSTAGKVGVLELAEMWQGRGADCRDAAAQLVQAGLKDDQVSTQVRAIILALKPEFGLVVDVAPLLKDPKPEVRRAAVLAVGPFRDLVPDEDLLPCLHDADEEVRGRCEAALKIRGLRDKDVLLGRLITDSSPLKRLEVIRFLPNDSQLDPQAWLNRLCQDSSPIVRASAARFALDPAAEIDADLSPRVRQMAQSDPDGTVRQIAEFLLRSRERPGAAPR